MWRAMTSTSLRIACAIALFGAGLAAWSSPAAAVASATVTLDRLTAIPVASGLDVTYEARIRCAAVDESLCLDLELDIPLPPEIGDASVPPHPYVESFDFVPGTGLTIDLVDSIPAGSSGSLPFTVATVNGTTPDGFTWDTVATLTGSNVATTSDTSDGAVSAAADIRIEKFNPGAVPDGERLPLDTTLRYLIRTCDPSDPDTPGNLFLEAATVVDTLPTGAVFVAASTNGGVTGVYDGSSETVTWSDVAGAGQADCDDEPEFWIDVQYPSTTFDSSSVVTNTVDIVGTAFGDAVTTYTDTASVWHRFGDVAGSGTTSKSASTTWYGSNDWTYAGDVFDDAPENDWQIRLGNTAPVPVQIEIVDPLPCLDNDLGTPGAAEYWSRDDGATCADPAWILEDIWVLDADMRAAFDAGLLVEATLADGTVTTFDWDGQFLRPPTDAAPVSHFRVPPDPRFELAAGRTATLMRLRGHTVADAPAGTLPAGTELWNEVAVDHHYAGASILSMSSADEMLVVDPEIYLGISKSYFIIGGEPRYSITTQNLSVVPVTGMVVTDLLPPGFTVDHVETQRWGPDGTLEIIDDYAGTGRQLLRYHQADTDPVPPNGGNYVLTVHLATPTLVSWPVGTTLNTAEVSLDGAEVGYCRNNRGNGSIVYSNSSSSGTPLHQAPLTTDTFDLDGDTETSDSFCQAERSLERTGSFALLSSEKSVLGDVDVADGLDFQGFPAVGASSAAGDGTYRLELTNDGSVSLQDIVVYDILPFVGDTGVSESQLATGRDTDWAPTLTGPVTAPAGATVTYSESTDPCRAEVSASNTSAPDCVDDWNAAFPGASARALRISIPGPIAPGESFVMTWDVDVPAGALPGEIAWSSFAVAATRSDTLEVLIPTEPPKVGLAVPLTDVSLFKLVDDNSVEIGDTVEFQIWVRHDGSITTNADGSVTYNGPASPARDLVVADTMPAGISLVPGSSVVSHADPAANPTFDEGTGVLTIGDLLPGEWVRLTYDATVDVVGAHTNTVEVTANTVIDIDSTPGNCGATVEDDCDSQTVTAGAPAIVLEKSVETAPGSGVFIPADGDDGDVDGDDGDTPHAVGLAPSGSPVTYRFRVTNTGGVALTDVTISDPQIEFFCPGFAVGTVSVGSFVEVDCTWPLGWSAGTTTNTASVRGTSSSGTVTDTDTADVRVPTPAITVEKATNGVDADGPADAVVLDDGDEVTWTYLVTNTGDDDLVGVTLVDTVEGTVTCPATTLVVGADMTCTLTGTASTGLYANTAAVSATGAVSDLPTADTDPSHYLVPLPVPAIDIEKATNGVDADTADAAVDIVEGEIVTWTYVVTNTGDERLTTIAVVDDVEGAITCPVTELDPLESTTCLLTGTAGLGDYVNTATATATPATTAGTVTDSDPSHHVGVLDPTDWSVRVDKEVRPITATYAAGETATVVWDIVITNDGDQPVPAGVILTDDVDAPQTLRTVSGPPELSCVADGATARCATLEPIGVGGSTTMVVTTNVVVTETLGLLLNEVEMLPPGQPTQTSDAGIRVPVEDAPTGTTLAFTGSSASGPLVSMAAGLALIGFALVLTGTRRRRW